MKIIIKKNYDYLSQAIGDFVINYVNEKPDSLLCFAGGDTPLGFLKYLINASKEKKVNFSRCKFVSLDEWIGLGKALKEAAKKLFIIIFSILSQYLKSKYAFLMV